MRLVQALVKSSFLCAVVVVLVGLSAAPAYADYVDQSCLDECLQDCGDTCAGTTGSSKAACIQGCAAENTECESSCVRPGSPAPQPSSDRSVRVAGFLPSANGFHFVNNFNQVSIPFLNVNGINIPFYGLCGGMSFAVRDYWEEGLLPPVDTITPQSGPLWGFILGRLIDSFAGGGSPFRYAWLMDPALPTHETWASQIGLAPHGLAWVTLVDEWPFIKADLDSGKLSPMGLILERTLDLTRIGNNHQVLAYGYDLVGTQLTIHVYDPNHPDDDGQTISLSIKDPLHTTPIFSSDPTYTIHAFIRHSYGWHASVGGRQNLAAFRPTAQSSTPWGADAARAVDGNTDGNWYNSSVTHTDYDAQAWWQVDLGAVTQIGEVVLYNRTDCCSERLADFEVWLHDGSSWVHGASFPGTASGRTVLPINRSGRYVEVRLRGTNYLSLAEVQVFAP